MEKLFESGVLLAVFYKRMCLLVEDFTSWLRTLPLGLKVYCLSTSHWGQQIISDIGNGLHRHNKVDGTL
jgi:hypothetical protein